MVANTVEEKKKAALLRTGRPDIETLEGNQMHYNLTSDDLEVEIVELLEQYGLGHWGTKHSATGLIEATIFVDERFTGDHIETGVTYTGRTTYWITATGSDMCEAMRNARNALVASAPVEIAKGA